MANPKATKATADAIIARISEASDVANEDLFRIVLEQLASNPRLRSCDLSRVAAAAIAGR